MSACCMARQYSIPWSVRRKTIICTHVHWGTIPFTTSTPFTTVHHRIQILLKWLFYKHTQQTNNTNTTFFSNLLIKHGYENNYNCFFSSLSPSILLLAWPFERLQSIDVCQLKNSPPQTNLRLIEGIGVKSDTHT